MKLKLSNVAKIENAELEMNGITVIAGENNTGKSTIGKVVFSLFNSLVNIEEKIARQKEQLLYQLCTRIIEQSLYHGDGHEVYDKITPPRLRNYARMMSRAESEEESVSIFTRVMGYFNNGNMKENEEQEFIEEAKKIYNLPVDGLTKSAVSSYFKRIFYSEVNNVYKEKEKAIIDATIVGKQIKIEFFKDNCIGLQQNVKILNEAVYLDNPFVLNCLNNGSYGRDEIELMTIKKLRKNTDVVEDVVHYSLIQEKIAEVLKRINELTSGNLLEDETHSLLYKETGNIKLNINNLSAGLKSFVIIKILLEKGALKERDVLILDEPEIHLHPAWQLIYAEIIVLLQKTFELTIVLTTHSAHFLDALSYFAKKHEIDHKCNYYLAKAGELGSVLVDVSDDLTKIYSELVDPSILLDKLKYKMEEDNE